MNRDAFSSHTYFKKLLSLKTAVSRIEEDNVFPRCYSTKCLHSLSLLSLSINVTKLLSPVHIPSLSHPSLSHLLPHLSPRLTLTFLLTMLHVCCSRRIQPSQCLHLLTTLKLILNPQHSPLSHFSLTIKEDAFILVLICCQAVRRAIFSRRYRNKPALVGALTQSLHLL